MSGFGKRRPSMRQGPRRNAGPRRPRLGGGRGNGHKLNQMGKRPTTTNNNRGGSRGGTKGGGTFTGPSTDMGPTVQAPPGLIDPGALLTMFA